MSDSINAKRVAKQYDADQTPGIKIDAGPHIGIVKNNVDPTRQGRLEVWIAALGGDQNEKSSWWTVSYASPFFGSTVGRSGLDRPDQFGTEKQTYGFWAVPPDLENQVLVTFVMGDPSKGYWFACIQNTPSMHMVPGIARPTGSTIINVDSEFGTDRDIPAKNVYLPASETNLQSEDRDTAKDYVELDRVLHTWQSNIVIQQGLETDPVRGTITSDSQRESPSRVFGFSTPGQSNPDFSDRSRQQIDELLKQGSNGTKIQDWTPTERRGGHTFVMDDGDVYGDNKLVRLRTAAGHQILMNDTENIIYISNSTGTAWVELTPLGSINVYSGDSINIRSEMDLNLHADGNVNINAGSTIKMYAGASIESQTALQLITAKDLYNINAGVVGVRSGGSIDVRALNSSWTTAGLMNLKNGSMAINTNGLLNVKNTSLTITSSEKTTISSGADSGWKTTNELWLKGSQIFMNTSGKVVPDAAAIATPVDPNINPPMDVYQQPNVRFDVTTKRWVIDRNSGLASIAPFTPTHEPWARKTGAKKLNSSNGLTEPPKVQTPKD